MTLVALQPAANSASRKHFADTIESSVQIEMANRFLPSETVEELQTTHPSGELRLWGAKPGESSQQVAKWSRLRAGDYMAFAAGGKLFAGAVITNVFRSAEFARQIWGDTTTANGHTQTWELMFAVAQIEALDVPYSTLNPLIERSPRANVQEFAVLSEKQSASLLRYLNREESSYEEASIADSLQSLTLDLDETDRAVIAKRRLEQSTLKATLLGRASLAGCDLCGEIIPVEFLTAAHIKRRSLCSEIERRQLTAVAMLNCRFGCDELYGKGYVGVDASGKVRVSDLLPAGAARNYAIERLAGNDCTAWNTREETRTFYNFHWERDFRRQVVV
ncbi:hypothetical protein G7068_11575 [Leucobacter viscericola]|uniref:HNH endonuclease n=1 Tax=Leucobacter viscericola TaxID=2714935 RepID=A0A6G7XH06_9MICO|nr:hypothetical protein [Leucobacter viscericola]QIK63756.1 hypothetical protein G7068_11575 [Leucobacter viscericola]